jgi:hypothetical protein
MTDKSTFVLKLSGIDLSNISAGDIGRLLNDFCKLLGDDHLYFDDIYSGSAVLKVKTYPEYYSKKIEQLNTNISKQNAALNDIHKIIRRYSQNFNDIEASILASRHAVNDEALELVHHIDYRESSAHVFQQNETLTGKLIRPAHGKDDTDHFMILLANGIQTSIEVTKTLSYEIAPFLESLWRHESLIRFSGIAKYEVKDNFQIKLKSFQASSFDIIENTTTAKSWMTDFAALGASGWQKEEKPVNTWLEERHS